MIVCLGFFSGDAALALDLLKWCKSLGGAEQYRLLLVADADVDWPIASQLIDAANGAFLAAELVTTDLHVDGWPQGSNSLWKRAAIWAKKNQTSFLWLEPDSIPVKPGWLKAIHDAYLAGNKPFMGRLYNCTNTGLPDKLMSGIGVYPANAIDLLPRIADTDKAWDLLAAPVVVPQANNTKLIHHFWGLKGLAPTFVDRRTTQSPVNAFTLDNVGEQTVLFHRNKDGTLLRLLRRKHSITSDHAPFLIVVPTCNRDVQLAIKNMQWMARLGRIEDHECLLSFPSDLLRAYASNMEANARQVFKNVSTFKYKCSSIMSWPEGANIAFRSTAKHVEGGKTSFLWMEPDAIPLKQGWQDTLQDEYDKCGQLFMGSVVPGMGHANGVAIYPADTCSLIPNSLSPHLPRHLAWDSVMKDEMIDLCHNSKYMQHIWGIVEGKPHPILGEAPHFSCKQHVQEWLNPDAVLMHRCKDGSLIDRLSEMQNETLK